MTDSLNQQLRDTHRHPHPRPDELHQPEYGTGSANEPAWPQSQAKTPDWLGGQSSARSGQPAPEAAQRGLPPHQFLSARRLREEFGLATPYSEAKRFGYGLLWTGWTVLLTIAGFSLLPHGSTVLSGLIALALATITGRYAYRIWTWRAKRLIFFIIW